jgi:hypothetical protein
MKTVAEGDLIQVNEDGPANWFRCILVVDEVKTWGIRAYAVIPQARGKSSTDAFMQLDWAEFDTLGVKSKFIIAPTMDMFEGEGEPQ